MELQTKQVTKKIKEYKEIKALLKSAFPRNEQTPISLLNHWAKKDKNQFCAYYEEDIFCGLTFTVSKNKTIFIMYLAITDKIRSKGFGSAILDQMKRQYPEYDFVLNIEPLDEKALNYEQRVKRFKFYKKMDFMIQKP